MPDFVTSPGETLSEMLDERKMTQAELAERMGRPKKTINEIIQAKTAITPETSVQFERVFGVPAEFWINREARYREYLAKKEEAERLEKQKAWLKKFPVSQMASFNWVQHFPKDPIQQIRELLNFFGVASPGQWQNRWAKQCAAFKKSQAYSCSQESISAWLRKGEIEASNIQCQPFDRAELIEIIPQFKALTNESNPQVFIPKIQKLCSEVGVAVVFVRNLKQAPVFGSVRWISPDKALLQLSVRYKSDDHLWFSFFHELGHILKHGKKDAFIEIKNVNAKNSEKEAEADLFASEALISSKEYAKYIHPISTFSKTKVRQIAREIGVSPGIVVGRLQHDGKLPPSHMNDLKQRYIWT